MPSVWVKDRKTTKLLVDDQSTHFVPHKSGFLCYNKDLMRDYDKDGNLRFSANFPGTLEQVAWDGSLVWLLLGIPDDYRKRRPDEPFFELLGVDRLVATFIGGDSLPCGKAFSEMTESEYGDLTSHDISYRLVPVMANEIECGGYADEAVYWADPLVHPDPSMVERAWDPGGAHRFVVPSALGDVKLESIVGAIKLSWEGGYVHLSTEGLAQAEEPKKPEIVIRPGEDCYLMAELGGEEVEVKYHMRALGGLVEVHQRENSLFALHGGLGNRHDHWGVPVSAVEISRFPAIVEYGIECQEEVSEKVGAAREPSNENFDYT